MNDLVSVIMPSYNTGGFIKESIQSVLNQTYSNWELLIVDDCSSDNTLDVISTFKDRRIKIISNSKNLGAAVSRNRALREASGRWVAFLDSDDLWKPEKLEKQIQFMENNSYAFSYTEYYEIDENDCFTGTVVTAPRKISKALMAATNFMGCLTVMYDKNTVGLLQIPGLKKRNDYALWLKAIKKSDAFLLNEKLAFYRVRTSNSLTDRGKNPLKLVKYNYQLWRESEHKSAFTAAVLSAGNCVFAAYKKMVFRKKTAEKGYPYY